MWLRGGPRTKAARIDPIRGASDAPDMPDSLNLQPSSLTALPSELLARVLCAYAEQTTLPAVAALRGVAKAIRDDEVVWDALLTSLGKRGLG